mmetsp:Transcript_101287/g.286814  ORF Transcript_101287/g.286814 Transcript_101287/m.286814 type:complete len:308 (-) Transcript_101287:2897-3820(-)
MQLQCGPVPGPAPGHRRPSSRGSRTAGTSPRGSSSLTSRPLAVVPLRGLSCWSSQSCQTSCRPSCRRSRRPAQRRARSCRRSCRRPSCRSPSPPARGPRTPCGSTSWAPGCCWRTGRTRTARASSATAPASCRGSRGRGSRPSPPRGTARIRSGTIVQLCKDMHQATRWTSRSSTAGSARPSAACGCRPRTSTRTRCPRSCRRRRRGRAAESSWRCRSPPALRGPPSVLQQRRPARRATASTNCTRCMRERSSTWKGAGSTRKRWSGRDSRLKSRAGASSTESSGAMRRPTTCAPGCTRSISRQRCG